MTTLYKSCGKCGGDGTLITDNGYGKCTNCRTVHVVPACNGEHVWVTAVRNIGGTMWMLEDPGDYGEPLDCTESEHVTCRFCGLTADKAGEGGK